MQDWSALRPVCWKENTVWYVLKSDKWNLNVLFDVFNAFVGFYEFPFPLCPRTPLPPAWPGARGQSRALPTGQWSSTPSLQLPAWDHGRCSLQVSPLKNSKKQDFCSRNIIPLPPSVCICKFNLHFNFYQFLKVSISIWINVFLQVLYIHDSILLPGSQASARNYSLPKHLVSDTRGFAIILPGNARLDSSHDISNCEGYPSQWRYIF